jgi:hypothetical protein
MLAILLDAGQVAVQTTSSVQCSRAAARCWPSCCWPGRCILLDAEQQQLCILLLCILLLAILLDAELLLLAILLDAGHPAAGHPARCCAAVLLLAIAVHSGARPPRTR